MAILPNVPDLPGVPNIARDPNAAAAVAQQYMTADTVGSSGHSNSVKWGVFLSGKQVVFPETFLGIDFREGWAIADYPVENGAFESYDKVDLPFDVRVRFASGGSESNRQKLLKEVHDIAGDLKFYDVVTPEIIYQNCNVQHYDYRRTARNGVGLIIIELWLLEVRVVPVRGAKVKWPSASATFDNGGVQSQTPTQTQQTKVATAYPQNAL